MTTDHEARGTVVIEIQAPADPNSVWSDPEPSGAPIEAVEQVFKAYGRSNYICPDCQRTISTWRQIRFGIPAGYEHLLNQIHKCPFCGFIFSPKLGEVTRVRRR